jgi:hypothetical protein
VFKDTVTPRFAALGVLRRDRAGADRLDLRDAAARGVPSSREAKHARLVETICGGLTLVPATRVESRGLPMDKRDWSSASCGRGLLAGIAPFGRQSPRQRLACGDLGAGPFRGRSAGSEPRISTAPTTDRAAARRRSSGRRADASSNEPPADRRDASGVAAARAASPTCPGRGAPLRSRRAPAVRRAESSPPSASDGWADDRPAAEHRHHHAEHRAGDPGGLRSRPRCSCARRSSWPRWR